MCGIFGTSPSTTDRAETINNTLRHRGPDYQGVWADDKFLFAHQLLSIRSDAAKSKQPFVKKDSPWVLVFNGQIYNIAEIKRELEGKDKNEELDTILIYSLIEKHGWSFIRYIHGMFAIGLYNSAEGVLRLYRDKSGQKNIYYSHGLSHFSFCSEIKGILKSSNIPSTVDYDGLMTAMSVGYIPGDKTLFKHIRKVRPGEVVTYREGEPIKRDYFEQVFEEYENLEPEQVMQKNVEKHLLSKKRVALNLSGGMDSSLLLHEMKELGHEMYTYTTNFESSDENLNKDAKLAIRLAQDYDTHHTTLNVTPDIYLKNLERACSVIEEPNYNISLATYLEVAKTEGIHGDGNRVILSGDGGDEVFGGYASYQQSLRYDNLMRIISPSLFNIYKRWRDHNYWDYGNPLEKWLRMKYFFMGGSSRRNTTMQYLEDNLPVEWQSREKDPVRDMMLLDRTFWLAGENFIRSDKLYMSESLELRSPLSYEPLRAYFDKRLTHKDYFRSGKNKYYLRNMYHGKLPSYITDREDKTGWRSPVKAWWNDEFKELFTNIFLAAPRGEHIKWEALADIIQRSEKWPGKYFHLYFSLAVLSRQYNLPL